VKHSPDDSLTLVAALLVAHGRGDDAAGARIAGLTPEQLERIATEEPTCSPVRS
jgi:hypothetical protein